jgi:hypothetical protein
MHVVPVRSKRRSTLSLQLDKFQELRAMFTVAPEHWALPSSFFQTSRAAATWTRAATVDPLTFFAEQADIRVGDPRWLVEACRCVLLVDAKLTRDGESSLMEFSGVAVIKGMSRRPDARHFCDTLEDDELSELLPPLAGTFRIGDRYMVEAKAKGLIVLDVTFRASGGECCAGYQLSHPCVREIQYVQRYAGLCPRRAGHSGCPFDRRRGSSG